MRFISYQDAVLWSFEILSCPLKAQVYDRETFGSTSYGKGNSYHDALEIKTQYDEAARLYMAEDDRGNWILLKVLPSQEQVNFRQHELRRIQKAVEHLKETLERTGFIEL